MLVVSPLTFYCLTGAFDYGSDLAVAETGSNVLANAGSWSNATGTLVVLFSAKSVAGTNYTMSFAIRNPRCCDEPINTIKIDSGVECFREVDARVLTQKSLLSSVPEGQDIESSPLKIRCALWRDGSIEQSMDFPCMDNELTAKLTLNVPIPAGATLTLTGLTESRTPDGVLTVTSVPSGAMTSGNWSKTSGILVIPILQDIPALTNVTYKFTIINPTAPAKESKVGKVEMSLDKVCALTGQNIPPYVLSQTNTGVIYVRQARQVVVHQVGC
jgi:hypothetical protein